MRLKKPESLPRGGINVNVSINDLGVAAMLNSEVEKIKKGLQKGLAAGGKLVEGAAKAKAPFDTGHLRESITSQADGSHCDIGTNVEYGIYQEFGTYKMAAHPFLVPALKENESEVVQAVKDNIK